MIMPKFKKFLSQSFYIFQFRKSINQQIKLNIKIDVVYSLTNGLDPEIIQNIFLYLQNKQIQLLIGSFDHSRGQDETDEIWQFMSMDYSYNLEQQLRYLK